MNTIPISGLGDSPGIIYFVMSIPLFKRMPPEENRSLVLDNSQLEMLKS